MNKTIAAISLAIALGIISATVATAPIPECFDCVATAPIPECFDCVATAPIPECFDCLIAG